MRLIAFSMIILLSFVMVFHLLVIIGIIPFSIVWGGRLKDASQMRIFEIFSIITNSIFLSVIGVKAGILKWKIKPLLIKIGLYLMSFMFMLNTLGNLMSKNTFEKVVFTPLTLISAFLCLLLAIDNGKT
jgi:hypothetical protein